jgi:hypothetical protein
VTQPELLHWLDARRPAAPPTLRAHLVRRAEEVPGMHPGDLADAGRALLARVLAQPSGGRELALDLLAADALVTYAFEVQAELDADGLVALARRISGGET